MVTLADQLREEGIAVVRRSAREGARGQPPGQCGAGVRIAVHQQCPPRGQAGQLVAVCVGGEVAAADLADDGHLSTTQDQAAFVGRRWAEVDEEAPGRLLVMVPVDGDGVPPVAGQSRRAERGRPAREHAGAADDDRAGPQRAGPPAPLGRARGAGRPAGSGAPPAPDRGQGPGSGHARPARARDPRSATRAVSTTHGRGREAGRRAAPRLPLSAQERVRQSVTMLSGRAREAHNGGGALRRSVCPELRFAGLPARSVLVSGATTSA